MCPAFTKKKNKYMQQDDNEGTSQSILVSGESRAVGKTKSMKMHMHYVAFLRGKVATKE